MDERRPTTPAAGPPRTAAGAAGLSPVQQAYSAYVTHAVGCDTCRSADVGPCADAEVLWAAYRQLRREAQAAARS